MKSKKSNYLGTESSTLNATQVRSLAAGKKEDYTTLCMFIPQEKK